MITFFALFIGLGSIRYAILGNFERSIISIMIAGFLDGVDGRIARALHSTTKFGAELDSLCDFVNFGVAPGFILYFWCLNEISIFGWWIVLLISVSLAIRLARFNIDSDTEFVDNFTKYVKKNFFVGIPAPTAGMLFLLPIALNIELKIIFDNLYLSLYSIFICLMTVSRIPTFSMKGLKINRLFLPVVILLFSMLIIFLLYEPIKFIIFGCVLYISLIPLSTIMYIRKKKQTIL
jgi:CDP-diacylglycerol--serine O-phosphatidyltransferase